MKLKHSLISALLLCLFGAITIHAQYGPPKPPLGKRWVLNSDLSDEFNGATLDSSKWYDYHPTWKGRAPGLFMKSQVSVKDGFLQIKGEKMKKDTIVGKSTFNIKGGAVVSKKMGHFGYYECKMKASKTTLSATFWFSGGGGTGPKGCDSYHQEWDIQECIGRVGDFKGKYFAKGMHSNGHFWYKECNGERHDYRAPQVLVNENELASENFHVYGGWWKDATSASYYYDHEDPKHQKFFDSISKTPMDKPMYMRLVCETYPFPWIELPNDEELADPTKNTVYYDWVRSYSLIEANDTISKNETGISTEVFSEIIAFDAEEIDLESSKTLSVPLSYKLNKNRTLVLQLTDDNKKVIHKQTVKALAGYSYTMNDLKLDKAVSSGSRYLLKATIKYDDASIKQHMSTSFLFINIK